MGSKRIRLSWPGFEYNICKAFLELRKKEELFDVTLACKDGKLEAHRFILSSCSLVFKDILKEKVPLVYIKDIKSSQLGAVLDFMYQGKVEIEEEDLEVFLTLAKEWQVKGLNPDESTLGSSFEETETEKRLKFRKPGDLFNPTVLGKNSENLTSGSSAKEMALENSRKEEELKKLQEDKVKLTEMVHSLKTAKKQMEAQVAAITTETLRQATTQDQEEAKMRHAEMQTKTEDLPTLQGQYESAINVQAGLEIYAPFLEKKVSNMANEIEALKSQAVQKEEEVAKDKLTVVQLKKIGRKFRDQKDEAEKEIVVLKEEKRNLEEELAKKASEVRASAALEAKLKDFEERVENLVEEKAALQKESDAWKKKSDELVERSFSTNPHELKKLREDKEKLQRMVQSLQATKKQQEVRVASISEELKAIKQQAGRKEHPTSEQQKDEVKKQAAQQPHGQIVRASKGQLLQVGGQQVVQQCSPGQQQQQPSNAAAAAHPPQQQQPQFATPNSAATSAVIRQPPGLNSVRRQVSTARLPTHQPFVRLEDSHKEGGNSKQLVEGQARSRSRLRCGAGSGSARCDNKDRGRNKQLHESSEQVDSFCRHWNQGYCWWENGSCNFQHRCSKELLMGEFCRSQRHGENEHRVTL